MEAVDASAGLEELPGVDRVHPVLARKARDRCGGAPVHHDIGSEKRGGVAGGEGFVRVDLDDSLEACVDFRGVADGGGVQ